MNTCKNLLSLVLILTHLCVSGAAMADEPKEEVDPLAIATVLLKAGQYEKVAQVFAELNTKKLTPEQLNRLHLLKAEYHLQRQDYDAAETNFRKALNQSKEKDLVRLKLIKVLFLQKKPTKVLHEIALLTPQTRHQPLTLQFEAEAYFLTDAIEKGFEVLSLAQAKYPDEIRFPLKRVVVLAEHSLAQTAVEEALELLGHPGCRAENLLQIAQIFTQQKDYKNAVILLEGARLQLFGTQKIAKALAFNYAQMGEYKLAGEVLYQSGLEQDEINLQSAELFRKAGDYHRAEWMNAQVENQEKKLLQRFGMLLQTKSFESAAALAPRLRRNGLTQEGQVQYGLAYAYFQTGQFQKSKSTLQSIRDDAYFEDAARLLQVVGDCIEKPVSCN